MLVVVQSTRLWVKLIRVHSRTSLQYHCFRSELHLGRSVLLVRPFEKHRMTRGWYIEIAWGRPMEDDIVRLDDDFGRT